MPGPKPQGERALSQAERSKRYRERLKKVADANQVVVRYRRPTDRRSKPKRWADAVAELTSLLDDYQDWRAGLPPSLAESAFAERLDEVLELRDLVEQLDAAELPKGFGRD